MRLFLAGILSFGLIACATEPPHSVTNAAEFQKYQPVNKFYSDEVDGIVGGVTVTTGDPHFMRAILIMTERSSNSATGPKTKMSSCTATALADNILLTAAHCVVDASPSDIHAVFRKGPVRAQKIVIHPNYDKTPQSKSDLAIVKLKGNIPSDYIYSDLYDGKAALGNDEVLMLGFGITDEKKSDSLILRKTTKSFKKDSFVKESLIGFNQTTKGGGYCRGDSGAPTYVKSDGRLKLIGINSFNVGTEKDKECHTSSFGMYIPYFRKWILQEVVRL